MPTIPSFGSLALLSVLSAPGPRRFRCPSRVRPAKHPDPSVAQSMTCFREAVGATEKEPLAGVTLDPYGNLYGTTNLGGNGFPECPSLAGGHVPWYVGTQEPCFCGSYIEAVARASQVVSLHDPRFTTLGALPFHGALLRRSSGTDQISNAKERSREE